MKFNITHWTERYSPSGVGPTWPFHSVGLSTPSRWGDLALGNATTPAGGVAWQTALRRHLQEWAWETRSGYVENGCGKGKRRKDGPGMIRACAARLGKPTFCPLNC